MANEANPFADVTKMIEQFKFPGLDMAPIVESRRKDMEVIVQANKATFEAMQAVARKQTEVFTQAMQGIQDSAKALAAGSGALMDPAKQAELVRTAYEKAMADMKDIAEMTRKSQAAVMAGITMRATESLQEVKKLMQPK